MLKRLYISNYALIDTIEIEFHPGLSIITGETGAGKSIILGALSLLLGQRAESKAIRHKDKKSVIEAFFGIEGYALEAFFEKNDIDYQPECILRREILPAGRTRAFVNDSPVTLAVLSELSMRLIDIHSQHSNALLIKPSYQLKVIDNLASNEKEREAYSAAYSTYLGIANRLKELKERIEKNKSDEDYSRFQLQQIAELDLQEGEQEELEKERNTLANISEIKDRLWRACEALGGERASAIGCLSHAGDDLSALNGLFDGSEQLSERLDSTLIEVKDIYETISQSMEELEAEPAALEHVEDRLNAIYALEQRHKVETVEELIAIQRNLEQSLAEIENSDDDILSAEQELKAAKQKLKACADALTVTRKNAAEHFAKQLQATAAPIGMRNLACKVDFEQVPFERSGQDHLQFLFAFNKSQQPMPVEKTASGGEISRLMLSIKSIIAEKMQLPSIIFDEVDTGVSGEVANKIGEMMKRISQRIQVISITHLPQVAALGDYHYKVYKQDVGDTTVSNVMELNREGRIREIAGMLSGSEIGEAAINNAKSLLNCK